MLWRKDFVSAVDVGVWVNVDFIGDLSRWGNANEGCRNGMV
jgi:hypothetical protein